MRKHLTLFTAGIILILSSCATKGDIDNLLSQIDGLKAGQIATIENQINSINGSITSLQETDREIKGYITALQNTASELQKSINSADGKIDDLEKALALVNSAIENLQAKDSALEQRITDLKDYVDTQLRGAKDWVSATFATLEQYNGIVSEIGGIKGSISSINTAMQQMESRLNGKITLMKGEIEEAYTKAIGSLESSLKNWVNEQLEGYWTIAETEGKLETLEGNLAKEDESIREDIGKLRSSLDSAKTELTEGYKAAIKKAIEENNGVLDGKLSEAVSGLNTRIDGEVSAINERIDAIEKRVTSLEVQVTALVSRIQSLAYIPRYTDGASTMWRKIASDGSIEARDTLDFRVSPADCADELVKVWEKAVSAEAVSLLTRSSQVTAALPVVSVTGGDGKISVVLDGSSLSEEFYVGEQQMRVVVIISDGNNERTSEYIPMLAKEIKSIIEVESVTINPQMADLVIGETLQLNATVLPSDASDKTVSWASSKQSVATVSSTGLVTAIAEGISTITASAGGKSATCVISVLATPVTSVTLDKTSVFLTAGETLKLTATVKPDNASDKSITWSSSNADVATVSSEGLVTARSEGSAEITVKTNDGGKTATCSVTVKSKVIPVSGVSLDKSELTLTEGDTQSLTATLSPENATDKSVTWSSDNESVAMVSSTGVVIAKSEGTAIIIVKTNDGSKTATCIVTVKAKVVSVTGVSLNTTSLTMTEGESQTLTATISPSNATDQSVTWASSNTTVATVSSSGIVSAKSLGTATITVKTNDGGKTATCQLTVLSNKVSVSGVSLDNTSLTMTEGETQSLKATVSPSNATDKSVTWSSNNESVAMVSSTGVVIARSAGTATITVQTTDGAKTATCTVTVKAKEISVTGVSLDKTSLTMTEGDTQALTATVSPSNATDKSVTWSTNNASVAEVSSTGVVFAKSAGTATITVKTTDGAKTATCTVTVKAKVISVTGVSLDKTSLTMTEGDTQTLTATVSPSNATNKSVTWSSNNTSVATVSSSGVVTAKSSGTATITVKTTDGAKTATCTVTVKAKVISVTGVSLDKTSLTMTEGDTQTLTATVTPSNATDKSVTWSSDNESVAMVSSSGVVTAKSAGSATITVRTNDGGKTSTCTVTVTAKVISVTGVSLDNTSLTMTEGDSQSLTATVMPEDATDKSVTWSSDNTSVADVTSSGVITAKSPGTATITVKTNDGGKTAKCYVDVKAKVIPVAGISLNSSSTTLNVGQTQTLTATVTPSNATDKTVSWSSSDATIAYVDSYGTVRAVSAGTATITATAGGVSAECIVTVVVPVTSVSLNKTELILEKGKSETLIATVSPSNATDKTVTWTTSDASVATVNNGVVTAKKEGTATITAKAGDKSATCVLTVNNPQTEIVGEEEGEW